MNDLNWGRLNPLSFKEGHWPQVYTFTPRGKWGHLLFTEYDDYFGNLLFSGNNIYVYVYIYIQQSQVILEINNIGGEKHRW